MNYVILQDPPTKNLGNTSEKEMVYWQNYLRQVLVDALNEGVVLRVETAPATPLAMGNHNLVVSAYPLRNFKG